ncbi:MAG TPA: ureidoglycolate hydrolase [Planctomycetes bacterium]|nr:ureidoglycolate hydrolase [Planctomycetota bacterium]
MNSSVPSPCVSMERMVSIHEAGIAIVDVPLKAATPESFRGFGHIVASFAEAEVDIATWPAPGRRPVEPGTGLGGGVTCGKFEVYRNGDMMHARNHAVDGHYITGWFADPLTASEQSMDVDDSRVLVREANYHPDGGQVFYPCDGQPFVALLARPGDDVTPQDFVAFYCDGTFGVHIDANVWHQPLFPIGERIVFDDKQGRVHACIACDFVKEFGAYLSVPLRYGN